MMRHGRVVACVLVLWCWCVLNGVVSAIDYKDALGKSILFFEGQRSGKLPNSQRVVWRGDSALSDGQLEGVNLTGGYYDAGDNVKFGWPMAYSVSLLSWSHIEYQQQISSAKQLVYLQGAIRWGTDFIIKAHPSPTTFYTQVGDGNADHQCWERPEDMDTSRKLYKITSSSPGSEAAAEAAAALAAASIVFKTVDSTYSVKLLRYSKSEYHAGNTNLLKYKTDAESFICAVMPGSSSSQVQRTPGGLLFIRDSSNLQYVTSSTLVLFIYSKTISSTQTRGVQCGSMFFSAEKIKAFAKSQVDYILGANPKKMSYMVGFGTTYPTKVHHRGSSIPSIKKVRTKVDCNGGYTYYNSGSPNPNTHVGAIVGGPDVNDQFQNARSDYSHSEPTTYINAAFVGSAAALLAKG
ncbi:hypothetical protein ACLB2K_048839 [Fragaria x ananassa]